MLHLWLTTELQRTPVCGAQETLGEVATRAYSRYLCPACLAWQERRCAELTRLLRDDQEGT